MSRTTLMIIICILAVLFPAYQILKFLVRYHNAKRPFSKDEVIEIEEKASIGDAEALSTLGNLYQLGYSGKKRNLELAINYFTKAAEAGSSVAAYYLGRIYIGKVDNTMIKIAKKTIEYPIFVSILSLYEKIKHRHDSKFRNRRKAFYWFHKAALAGEVKSYEELANCYFEGNDYHKAAWWFLKADTETGSRNIYSMTDTMGGQLQLPTKLELFAKAVDDIKTGQWKPDGEL